MDRADASSAFCAAICAVMVAISARLAAICSCGVMVFSSVWVRRKKFLRRKFQFANSVPTEIFCGNATVRGMAGRGPRLEAIGAEKSSSSIETFICENFSAARGESLEACATYRGPAREARGYRQRPASRYAMGNGERFAVQGGGYPPHSSRAVRTLGGPRTRDPNPPMI